MSYRENKAKQNVDKKAKMHMHIQVKDSCFKFWPQFYSQSHLSMILLTPQWGRYYYSFFIDKGTSLPSFVYVAFSFEESVVGLLFGMICV